MVLLVPERILKDLWPLLTRAYEPRLVARLPRGEYEIFHQAVVVAEKVPPSAAHPRPYPGGELPHLEDLPLSFSTSFGERLRSLPDRPLLEGEVELDEEKLLELARKSPLWALVEGSRVETPRPLLPLKESHLALLFASGALDLEEVSIDGVPHLALGVLKKAVEWHDNIGISDRPPAEYAPQYERRFPPEQLREMYRYHALPEGWYGMDYPTFLEKRRHLMASIIREGFERLARHS